MGLLDKFNFSGSANDPLLPKSFLGQGMAAQAAQIMQSQPYRMHVQEAKAMGQTPMTPEEFAKMMQGKGLLSQ